MDENEGRNGKAVLAVSMVGILLGSMMLVGLVRAGEVRFAIPIPNPTGITLNARAYNGRLGGGDSLIFQVDVEACSRYGVDSVVSSTIIAYSDSNPDTRVRYARVGFHHVIVPYNGCVTETKTVRVHHASMAAADADGAYISATAVIKRDGAVSTAADTAWVDIASLIRQVLAP